MRVHLPDRSSVRQASALLGIAPPVARRGLGHSVSPAVVDRLLRAARVGAAAPALHAASFMTSDARPPASALAASPAPSRCAVICLARTAARLAMGLIDPLRHRTVHHQHIKLKSPPHSTAPSLG